MNLNQMLHMQSAYETFRVECERALKEHEQDPYAHDSIFRIISDADRRLENTLSIIRKELKD